MHRRESIMQAIDTALTGLATTGQNVERSRVWPVHALPALTIAQGEDTVDDDTPFDDYQRTLGVDIVIHVQDTATLETEINAIAAEVHAALMAAGNLGLAYVTDLQPVGDGAPQLDDAQDIPIGRMSMSYAVQYEHSIDSTEV